MVGECLAHGGLESVDGPLVWGSAGEVCQDRLAGLLVAGPQVEEGLFSRGRLLLVAALCVPIGGCAG